MQEVAAAMDKQSKNNCNQPFNMFNSQRFLRGTGGPVGFEPHQYHYKLSHKHIVQQPGDGVALWPLGNPIQAQ